MSLKNYRPPFEWIFSLFIITLVALPVVVVWTEELRRWYYTAFLGKETRSEIRITYAIIITIIAITILFLLYKYTSLFTE